MRLLLVRHAIAVDGREFPGRDADRPLTEEGRERFARGARALAALVPELARIVSSPFVRCRETAEILAAAYRPAPPSGVLPSLTPAGDPRRTLEALASLWAPPAVALVGHEPSLSALEALLLTGRARSFTVLKKGGAALLEGLAEAEPGRAALVWHLTPAQLRNLAR